MYWMSRVDIHYGDGSVVRRIPKEWATMSRPDAHLCLSKLFIKEKYININVIGFYKFQQVDIIGC